MNMAGTLKGDEDFYIDTVVKPHFAFTVFASKYVIDFINKNIEPNLRSYLLDGTFDSLPDGYYQLLVISIEYKNDVRKNSRVRPSVRPSTCPFVRASINFFDYW